MRVGLAREAWEELRAGTASDGFQPGSLRCLSVPSVDFFILFFLSETQKSVISMLTFSTGAGN